MAFPIFWREQRERGEAPPLATSPAEAPDPPPLVCEQCGFVAKSVASLHGHKGAHRKRGR
jgi:hypothetical protein